jgi:RND family efflux transporter MFP subunit
MPIRLLLAFLPLLLLSCGKDAKPPQPPPGGAAASLLLAPEDLLTVHGGGATGPLVTGSVQPARRADLRAEVSAIVLRVLKENGDPVQRGDLLVKLDDTAIRDALGSAEEAERAAARAFDQGERQVQRLRTLQGQGMSSIQALEDAEVRRNSAQSELAAARSRVVSARQQLQRTEVRAPFAGVVSDRKVSAGDTAQIGKELVKVIDPGSLRLEGRMPADRLREVAVGQTVHVRISGQADTPLRGRISRVDAAADPATRQLEVLVDLPAAGLPRLAGLYAEGRIETDGGKQPMVPESALRREGDSAFVWLVKDGRLHRRAVVVGARDGRSGSYPLLQGAAEGDRILRHASGPLQDGRAVEVGPGSGAAATAVPLDVPATSAR